jgi:hypothetical protein
MTSFSVIQSCLVRWPVLCDQLLKLLSSSSSSSSLDQVTDQTTHDDGALSNVERLMQLSDEAAHRTVQPITEKTSRKSVSVVLQELLTVVQEVYEQTRLCEAQVAELLARGDVPSVTVVRGSSWLSMIDAAALLREISMHFETDFQLRVDLASRFQSGGADADERQVLRLAWLALPTPLPVARRFVIAQQLQEVATND